MKVLSRLCWLVVVLVHLCAALAAQGGFHLRDGDRVVFYGDSITDQRLYTAFVESYVVTRWPGLNVSFVHSGWGGDRVTGGAGGPVEQRLERDVIAYKPTVVTIMLGMNDGSYRAYDPDIFNTYANGYRKIIKRLKEALPGVRITVIQPSPYDDVTRPALFEGGYNAVLKRYGQFVEELAEQEGLTLADLNTSVVAALQRASATDAALAQRIVPDRVHPGASGHLLMAAALLKAWNAPPIVSEVEIDAAARRVTRAEGTKVEELTGEAALSWTQTDRALPTPIDLSDPVIALAVRSSDVMASLNRQTLKVIGLSAARYSLSVDGQPVGTFTGEQLSQGINLAELVTPMIRQALAVHALTLKHNNVHFARWRQVQVPLQSEMSPAALKAMDALASLQSEIVARQRAAAAPKARRFELAGQ